MEKENVLVVAIPAGLEPATRGVETFRPHSNIKDLGAPCTIGVASAQENLVQNRRRIRRRSRSSPASRFAFQRRDGVRISREGLRLPGPPWTPFSQERWLHLNSSGRRDIRRPFLAATLHYVLDHRADGRELEKEG